jgi:hypothetical protein
MIVRQLDILVERDEITPLPHSIHTKNCKMAFVLKPKHKIFKKRQAKIFMTLG